ncbi:hypothetical protein MXD63_38655, partial [Frankia sp. Cpl3]|nr:hypothetical protein [Frankia sp. Cpl3]
SFDYPTSEQRETIQVIHRDMTVGEEEDLNKRRASAKDLLKDLESGRLYVEDLDPEFVQRMKGILGRAEQE